MILAVKLTFLNIQRVNSMKKTNKTLVLAMSTTLITGLTSAAMAGEVAEIQGNVFKMTELSSGYMQLAAADANTAAKPAAAKSKTTEGKCAGAKPISTPKAAEGKCGEGQCGGTMKAAATGSTAKPAAEPAKAASANAKPANANATGKATEGKCGEGKCGGEMKKAAEASAAKK